MTDFQIDYSKAQRHMSKDEIIYTRKYIQDILLPYIKNLQSQNPDLTIEEMENLIKDDAFDLAETSFKSNFAFDYYMQYVSCQYLQSHPKVFDDIYSKLESGELKIDKTKINIPSRNNFNDYLLHYIYSANKAFKGVYKQCEEFLSSNNTLKNILDDPNLKTDEKLKKAQTYINRNFSSKYDRSIYMENINYYVVGLKRFLPCDEKFLSKELKNILTDSISSIAKQLSRLNLFQKYRTIEASHFEKMNFQEFISGKKSIDITNPEILRNIPVHDLMILNSFWINRYAKELDTYSKGIFTIKTLNLLPKIINGTFDTDDINRFTLESTLIKWTMLREHAEHFINDRQEAYYTGKLTKNNYTVSEDGKYITFSFVPFAKRLKSRYLSEYEFSFNSSLPDSDNTIENNTILHAQLISPVINIYDMKDEILNSLISNLGNNPDIVNAGIIPDSVSDDKTQITLNPNFVCLGLDTKLTFPVREHINLSVLKDFLVSLQNGNEYIPIYEGSEDFKFLDGKIISAQQILPFTKEQEKLLRKTISAGTDGDFIRHLYWLLNPSCVPEKFLSSIVDDKGRTKNKFIRKYVNLKEYTPSKPLQVYVQQDDKFIPIANSKIKTVSNPDIKNNSGGKNIEF